MARVKSKPEQDKQAKKNARKMKIKPKKTPLAKRPHRYRPGYKFNTN